jgi:hypothetical protein
VASQNKPYFPGAENMNRYLVAIIAFACGVFASVDVGAVEVLSAEELASHCEIFHEDAEGVDGQYCVRYIQGFIDGAVATDVRVMLNMEAERDKETFTERAIRTRMIDRNSMTRAAGYAEFCLGDPVPLIEVVEKVIADLDERVKATDSSGTARDVVYESLRRHYPCEKS